MDIKSTTELVSLFLDTGVCASKPAIITGKEQVTYADLADRAKIISEALLATQNDARKIIYLRAKDPVIFLSGVFGAWGAGFAVVPIYHLLPATEVEKQMKSLGPGILLQEGAIEAHAMGEKHECDLKDWSTSAPASINDSFLLHYPDGAYLRFTSGTTGDAKGVVVSSAAIEARTKASISGLEISKDDIILCPMQPAFHLIVSLLSFLRAGATIIITPEIRGDSLLDLALEYGATFLYASPVHYRMLAAESSGRPWHAIRRAISTSTKIGEIESAEFRERFCVMPSQGLGVIEVGMPLANLKNPELLPHSVGEPLPGYEVALLDENNAALEPEGAAEGRLAIKGPGMFAGYAAPYKPADEILIDGMFLTGDFARRDAKGRYYIEARVSNVIHAGGHKVFPEAVEEVLLRHRAVEAVRVSGKKHQRFGEIVVAEIVRTNLPEKTTGGQLATYCRKYLAPYQIPQIWKFISELPETPSGKIRRT